MIIAGIRDYAEYVPLERGLFDLIIIDEASQVSIAQALPAFIRAKKVLVLGDRNQFSNVKTENASNAINQSYKATILDQFRKEETPNEAMLNQVKLFDIKTSVLDYVERIANRKIMLRKHFRGYPELISFSSKYFYGGAIQAVKIRGKPVDQIINFQEVEHDGVYELHGNSNQPEVDAIIQKLSELQEIDDPPDVCVITPHTEQQRLILQSIQRRDDWIELVEKLKLRVFTFDTCQGEEAHTVIYSMVATQERDRLNYVFAKDLAKSEDVEENLRLQRLNVGFSRARERIIIFHSKPFSEFQGGIQVALMHYQGIVERGRRGPEAHEVDPTSPMELKVLNWLREIPLVEELGERIEIDAGFELGAYLRQLDPTYRHPNYKVDFLVKVQGELDTAQIIIEYDGFREHFEQLDEVNAQNYQFYMKPADIERQKILEGYGYKFLRINRFNMGENPVKTLDQRLRRLIDRHERNDTTPRLVEEHQKQQESLRDGKTKVCTKCGNVKDISKFFDQNLKNGLGSYGRVCIDCKTISQDSTRLRPKISKKPKHGQQKKVRQSGQGSSRKKDDISSRTYINCPYSEKDECKAVGGRWDPYIKKWYIPTGIDKRHFHRWM